MTINAVVVEARNSYIQCTRGSRLIQRKHLPVTSIEEYLSGKTDGEEVLKHVESAEEIKAAVRELKIMHLECEL